ncbi:hypothetical protein DFH07DRAFT_969136 [Mycena maculata]|uniref:Uncharacterized protein n=1 Tax=Mycena maculata TaxID=230809 RepID=A0AAD7HXG4_9AGAR|nr:hypothetical protein DFH07DRAFT_969136 [Mycena maculata]
MTALTGVASFSTTAALFDDAWPTQPADGHHYDARGTSGITPVDTGLDDDNNYDLELLPQEKHIRLALAASQADLMFRRKAVLDYGALRSR